MFIALTSAPAEIRNFTVIVCPIMHAVINGVESCYEYMMVNYASYTAEICLPSFESPQMRRPLTEPSRHLGCLFDTPTPAGSRFC
jgi:hypothetical protein